MPYFASDSMVRGDTDYGDPRLNNLLAWTWDPIIGGTSGAALTTGLQYFQRVEVPRSVTFTNVIFETVTGGATLTAGANNLALYNAAGTQIAATADQTTNYTTTGIRTVAFTTPVAVAGGPGVFVWIGYKSSGTTPVSFRQLSPASAALVNANLTTANYRSMSNGTNAATLMPASITIGSNTAGSKMNWLALS